jgi:dTDP-4-amino-4,6-dideoxygalactose transaminase
MIGWNARMDGIQGAVLNVKLKHLPAWNEARRKNAKRYTELFSTIDKVIEPVEAIYAKHVYHVYTVRVQNREKLMAALTEKGISCGIHYPVPIHLQEAYLNSCSKNSGLKVSERVTSELLSLPMFPELNYKQQVEVKDKIQEILSS